jgi:phytoene dehydrogenase-like protein
VKAARPDVIVVGGGHNGLVTAALLAKGGLKPLVLERRHVLGGATVTEEIHPGYKVSTVAHLTGPLRPSVLAALGLQKKHGLTLIEVEPRTFAPQPDGRGLTLWGDPARTAAELKAFSPRDAERYPGFHRSLSSIGALLGRVLEMTPPDVDRPLDGNMLPLLKLGLGFRGLGRPDAQRLLRWGPMPVADFASEWFETEALRAVVSARGITGMLAGPWSAGTTANLLLQSAAGNGNGAGSAVYVKGGLGALALCLAAAASRFGAEVRTGAEVERITTKDGRVTGVVLAGGEEIAARAVVSGADPHRTFLGLLDPAVLDPDDLRRIRHYRQAGMASKVNLALSALPSFSALRGLDAAGLLRGRIHMGPDVDMLERAFDDAKYGDISSVPWLEATIPSLVDPTLASPGRHVMSVYVQYTPYTLKSGSWGKKKDELGDLVLRTLETYAPGIGDLVLARRVVTPVELEETYGLTAGHPFHGEPSLDQIFLARPLLGWARYRGPVAGLYLCGAGAHPGGGVTGGPGANAAREVLKDLR